MKLNKLFAVLGLGLFALASVGAGLALSANDVKDVKADADPAPAEDVVQYFDMSNADSNFCTGGNVLGVWMYCTDGSGGEWASDLANIGNNVYKFTLTAGNGRFKVASHNGDSWQHETYAIDYNTTYNLYKVGYADPTQYNYGVAYLADLYSDQRFELDVRECSDFWFKDDADAFLYSCYGDGYAISQLNNCWKSNVYTGSFGARYVEKFLIVRGKNFTSDADFTDPEKCFNQTEDIVLTTSANEGKSFVALGPKASADPSAKITIRAFEERSVNMFAEAWGYQFLQLPICSDAGGMVSGWQTQWDLASTSYYSVKADIFSLYSMHLDTYLKTLSTTGALIANDAMKRYDTAIVKNHLDLPTYDFLERGPTSVGSPIVLSTSDTTTLITTITVVTLVAISAILVFVVIKKRKYN